MKVTILVGPRKSSAEMCRKNGWVVGSRLIGDEGNGPTVIEITAIGEIEILAKKISHNGHLEMGKETNWTLEFRDWKIV